MSKNPLSVICDNDPALAKLIGETMELAFEDGAVSAKHKALIALAIDASKGAADGVRSLAQQAMRAGATREEIQETLHVVYAVCGGSSMFTAAAGLDGVL